MCEAESRKMSSTQRQQPREVVPPPIPPDNTTRQAELSRKASNGQGQESQGNVTKL